MRGLPGADPARHHGYGGIDRRGGRGGEGPWRGFFGSAVLRLAPQVKEHYLAFVRETFPDLLPRYERAYAGTNISSDYQTAIERRIARIRERQGFAEDAMQSRRDRRSPIAAKCQVHWARSGQLVLPL